LEVPRLLSLGLLHETIGRIGPRSQKILALVVALVSTIVAFVLAGGEAQAQEQQAPAGSYTAVVDEYVVVTDEYTVVAAGVAEGPVIETPLGESGVPPARDPLVDATPPVKVDSVLPVDQPDAVEPLPAALLSEQYDPEAPVDPIADPGTSGDLGPEVLASQVQPAPAIPDPVAFGQNEPVPGGEEEYPVDIPTTSERPATPLPENKLAYAIPPVSQPSAAVRNAPIMSSPVTGPGPPKLGTSVSGAAEYLQSAAASVLDTLAGGSAPEAPTVPTGGDSSEDVPQPSSPSTPPLGGSSFSLSGNGQAGPSGSVVIPLLLCVLVSGLILLRRDGPLSWASCELPKPSSVLLLPLERPG